MKIAPLTKEMVASFLSYCDRYGPEHDESYLPDDHFAADPDNPTVLLLDERGEVAGAASLMLDAAYRAARKGRFRILHALEPAAESYRALLSAILPAAQGLDEVYLFIPEGRQATVGRILEGLGFEIERYSWYLKRRTAGMPDPAFADGFVLRPVRRGVDEAAWAAVVNTAFAALKGHIETTPERVRAMYDEPCHRDEGMLALWHGSEMVGTVRVTDEESNGKRGGVCGRPGRAPGLPASRPGPQLATRRRGGGAGVGAGMGEFVGQRGERAGGGAVLQGRI